MLRVLICALLAYLPLPVYCAATTISNEQEGSQLIAQAKQLQLYQHPYWIKLLHYKKTGIDQVISEITSNDFFLATRGKTNPEEELYATIHAMLEDLVPDQDENAHAQCKFIARYHWLKNQLDWSLASVPDIKCNNFDTWSLYSRVESLSLVFATGYLGNPASFYGHLLLKMNTDRQKLSTSLLDQSINFGAIVPDNEHPLVYVIRGLFGGYTSSFSNGQFYRHNLIYIENEFRDLWEYQLSLDHEQVYQILYHSWELMHSEFTYYFLKENCAWRMSELLELVVDQPLLQKELPWSMPASVFEHLISANIDGRPLVSEVKRIPSRQNRLYGKFVRLDAAQQEMVRTLVENELQFSATDYQALPELDKIRITDTLIDYYEYRILNRESTDKLASLRHRTLIERSRYGIAKQEDDSAISVSPPHHGPLPTMVRTSIIYNSALKTGVEFNFRPAYFDTLSIDSGRIAHSTLSMFDLRLAYIDDTFEIRALDMVNIETLNSSPTGLPGDRPLGWKIKFGYENQGIQCTQCGVFKFTGGMGKAVKLSSQSSLALFMDVFAHNDYMNSGTLGNIASLNIIHLPVNGWKSKLSYGYKNYFNGSESHNPVLQWNNRFGTSRDWDLRLDYIDDIEQEVKISVSLYW